MERLGLVVTITLLAAACAGDAVPDPSVTTSTTPVPTTAAPGTQPTAPPDTPAAGLPPHTADELIAILEPVVAPLGFTVTRAALVDLSSYRTSPEGTHLAVYVAPVEPMDADAHAARYVPLARAFLPDVFERWPGLRSFDVCQEPHAWDLGGTPPSRTLLDVDRETAASIDWSTVTLTELVERAAGERHLIVTADPDVASSPTWSAATSGQDN